tara:strand:+ start:9402 stop:10223 length:822 start_codon:yes stop_codon:yes gene_type:complete
MLKESYSQEGQDTRALNYFNGKKEGYFVDIGANEGIIISNTYLFEKKLYWKGICSEPLPKAFELLQKNRDVICDNNAVYSKSNLKLEFSCDRWLSGITTDIDQRYLKTLAKPRITVNTITFQDLLTKHNAPKIIHYLSLDTEGSEYKILESVDLKKHIFLYICVEHNGDMKKRKNISNLLVNNNYIYKGAYKQDDEYIHENAIIGKYYMNNDYTKEITISRISYNNISVIGPDFKDIGRLNLDTFEVDFEKLGKGKIYYGSIDLGNNNIWVRK